MKPYHFLFIFSFSIFVSQIGIAQVAEVQDTAKITQEALGMIAVPDPTFNSPAPLPSPQAPNIYQFSSVWFPTRNGDSLHANHFPAASTTTILLLHGVLSSAEEMNMTAGLLRESASAEVYAIDLRGHGQSSGKAGDIEYVDQYTDDIADAVTSILAQRPNQQVLLAGHSMGGGISLRYAGRRDVPEVDGYLLFAPSLGHNSPGLRQESSPAASEEEPFLKIHIPRLIGIYLLNSVGNHEYDSLNILFFHVPADAAIRNYSYRSNTGNAPEDYIAGLKAVNKPMLVLIGSEDEAFDASAYPPAIDTYSDGQIVVIDGASHNGVCQDPGSMDAVTSWISQLPQQ